MFYLLVWLPLFSSKNCETILGFTLEAKSVSSEDLIQVHLKILSCSVHKHFTLGDTVY